MPSLVEILLSLQALGAIVGACYVVLAELAYIRAHRDGRIDSAERAHLAHLGRALRFGMVLLLLSSLALVFASYRAENLVQPGTTSAYWAQIVFALLTIAVSWALSRNLVSFATGSAVAFSAWWFLAYQALGQLPELSFGALIALYVVVATVFGGVLYYLRMLTTSK